MIKALVVGCGQIGALYDIDKDEMVLSHAKAYHLSKDVDLVKVIDKDMKLAKKVASIYNCKYSKELSLNDLCSDLISIATPTSTHYKLLKYLYENDFKGKVILEKPVAQTKQEIEKIEKFDRDFLDRVYVNYIRRYDEVYRDIFQRLKLGEFGKIESIESKIFGTFAHNGIHLINLLNYLFETKGELKFKSKKLLVLEYDDVEILIETLDTDYLNYDLNIFTKTYKISFSQLGYKVDIYKSQPSSRFENIDEPKLVSSKNILHRYALGMVFAVINSDTNIPKIFEGIRDFKMIEEFGC